MAFLFEEDRGLTVVKDPYPHLGPGVYEQEQVQHTRHGYAPFMSTDKRITSLTDKKKILQPGPGQYEIGQTMGDSGVQAYMNKSTIIVKVQGNGSSAFKSNIDRFQGNKQQSVPGPGAYDMNQNNMASTANSNNGKQNNRMEDIRSQNNQRKINSIPETKNQIGVYQDIESLAQHQQELVQRLQYRVIGPTTYDVKLPQNKNGIKWDKNQQPRFSEQKVTNTVGPGKYNPQQPQQKRNASPAFVSESVRSYFDKMVYNTNSELKAELRKRTNYQKQTDPGPGSYNDPRAEIKVQNKPREFQFFGSSLERFKQMEQSCAIGPGTYNINNSSFDVGKQKRNFTNATFLSTTGKDESLVKDESMLGPGPGSYEVGNNLQHQLVKRYDKGYKGSFGLKEKRFEEKNILTNVGPGSYNMDIQERRRAVSSSFKSGTKRDQYQKNDGPAIGQYKLDNESIANRQQKQTRFLKNLEKIDVQKPPFDSGQERFIDGGQNEQRQRSYTTDYVPCSNPQTKFISAPFKSQAPRIGYLSKQHTPGVGKYHLDQNKWNINSFNTHYNKLLADGHS